MRRRTLPADAKKPQDDDEPQGQTEQPKQNQNHLTSPFGFVRLGMVGDRFSRAIIGERHRLAAS